LPFRHASIRVCAELRWKPELTRKDMMDKTLKLRTYSGDTSSNAAQGNIKQDEKIALELEKKTALLEEERSKSIDLLKTIVQLRESLKQEEARTAELEAKLNKLATEEESQLARKSAQLEEEQKMSLEYMRTIEQLRESIRLDQAKSAEMVNKFDELEAKTKALAEMEEKIKELTGVLGMISRIATAGKVGSND
jgi:predicted RNase H-like nuclease (RuvC/YqgF family)